MDTATFDDRVAIVTGAGRGMGRAHALYLAARGARLVVNDVGASMDGTGFSSEPALEVVQDIKRSGGAAIANTDDVSNEEGVKRLVGATLDEFGRVDIVIHNAGTATFVPFGEMSYEQFRRVVAVHADGAFLVARAAWPHMVRQRYGRLVFITSQAALTGVPQLAHYAVGKWGETGLCKILALEGEPHGIRANALGVTALTRMMEPHFRTGSESHEATGYNEHALAWWRRHVTPELISPVVAWLAHEQCSVSGEIFDTTAGHVSLQQLTMTAGYTDPLLTLERLLENVSDVLNSDRGRFPFKTAQDCTRWMHEKVARKLGVEPPRTTEP
jgi:NAD(P)-dependent dehydrogenase (short-subunit alcohol dehydrogenase family)